MCESEAPAVFRVSKDNVLEVLDATRPTTCAPRVEAAVKYCPTHAL